MFHRNTQHTPKQDTAAQIDVFHWNTPSVPDSVVDRILSSGGNKRYSCERITAFFMRDHVTGSAAASFLQKEYGAGGKGFHINGMDYALWFDADGLRIAEGRSTRTARAVTLSWPETAGRIQQLLQAGRYADRSTLETALPNEYRELAVDIAYVSRERSKGAIRHGYLAQTAAWVKETNLESILPDDARRGIIAGELSAYASALKKEPELCRYHRATPRAEETSARLAAVAHMTVRFPEPADFQPERPSFITEDEIDELLCFGTGYANGQTDIYSYFKGGHTSEECVSFLRSRYGIGGKGALGYDEWHDNKGISLRRSDAGGEYASIELSWKQVAKRIHQLIRENRYLTPDELEQYESRYLEDAQPEAPDASAVQSDVFQPNTQNGNPGLADVFHRNTLGMESDQGDVFQENTQETVQTAAEKTVQGDVFQGNTSAEPEVTDIRFYWNGLRLNGSRELVKCSYSLDNHTDYDKCVTISAKDYGKRLPSEIFSVVNNTDTYSDYHDTDHTTLTPEHPLYRFVRSAAEQAAVRLLQSEVDRLADNIAREPDFYARDDFYKKDLEEKRARLSELKSHPKPGQPKPSDLTQARTWINDRQAALLAEQEARRREHIELVQRQRSEGRQFVESIARSYPVTDGAPVVTISFSENPAFYDFEDGITLSVRAADLILRHYDEAKHEEGSGYDKTDIAISYTDPSGQKHQSEWRYDLGDDNGGLIGYLSDAETYYREHGQFDDGKPDADDIRQADEISALITVLQSQLEQTAHVKDSPPPLPAETAAISDKTAQNAPVQSSAGKQDFRNEYQLLDRLRSDCEYFLGEGQRNEKHLWAGNVFMQIAKMRELYDALPDKPEWLTKEAIDSYEERMSPRYQVVVYHPVENGFDEKQDFQTLEKAEKAAQGYVDGTMEPDGFAYDGAAVYDHKDHKYIRIWGNYPDQAAQEDVFHQNTQHSPDTAAQSNVFHRNTSEESATPKRTVRTVKEVYDQYLPVMKEKVMADAAYQNACLNSDEENARIEADAAVRRAAVRIGDTEFLRLYYDLSSFHNRLHQAVFDETYPALHAGTEQPAAPDDVFHGNTQDAPPDQGNVFQANTQDESVRSVATAPAQDVFQGNTPEDQKRDVLAPAYQVGTLVYLDNAAYVISRMDQTSVWLKEAVSEGIELLPMSRTIFENRLFQDARNGMVTEYLTIDPAAANDDLRESLTSENGLLDAQDKALISRWFRAGEGNTSIAQKMSETYAGTTGTLSLLTGEYADYTATTTGFSVELQDRFGTEISRSWFEIARLCRAMYQQEKDGFVHDPQPGPEPRAETPAYEKGDPVDIVYGDKRITGTIDYIGDTEVHIQTGPYSWSGQTINRVQFEACLRRGTLRAAERKTDAHTDVFQGNTPEEAAQAAAADPSYDVFQGNTLEETARNESNYHITDDLLGVSSPRERYRNNIAAIRLLRTLEEENRPASPDEQDVLAQYTGWGAIPQAFDADNPAWANEYAELKGLLTDDEYKAARASTLNAHYTSPTVIGAIYDAVEHIGLVPESILEIIIPSLIQSRGIIKKCAFAV